MKPLLSLIIALLFIEMSQAQNVGIGTNSPSATAALDVSSTNKGFLPPRMDSTQRNAIVSPAAGLTIYNTSIKAFQCYNGSAWYSTVHYVGESYGGGIVFYSYDNGQHGLIAATADYSSTIQWYNGTYRYTGNLGDGVGGGEMNTAIIVAMQIGDNQAGNFAAQVCADYSVTVAGVTYGDWYLPSRFELNLLYLQQNVVGGFTTGRYWTSTDFSLFYTCYQAFSDGFQSNFNKNSTYYVRAIRAF
jgi:hypothetical protein